MRLIILFLLLLTSCTRTVIAYKTIDKPVPKECRATITSVSPLFSKQRIPRHLSKKKQREWKLNQMDKDIIMKKGEAEANFVALSACENKLRK